MTKSKLIGILKSFDRNQFKRFGQFVSSPFFNSNPTLVKLYGVIQKYHPGFPEQHLHKQEVFSKIYPAKKYNDGAMRNLISDMMDLAQKFIVQLSVDENSFDTELSLLGYFNLMKLDDLFEKKIQKVEDFFSKSPVNEEVFFSNLRFLEREKQLFYSTRNKEYLDRESGFKENLYAIYSFLFDLFRAAHNALNRKYTYNDSSLLDYINELSTIINIDKLIYYFKSKNFEYSEIIEQYYLSYLALIKLDDDEHFYRFRQSLKTNHKKFSVYALYNLILSYENCCTYKIQEGKYDFIEKYIDFQKWMDSNKISSTPEKYYYNSLRFINTITYACYLKDFEWIDEYIKKYLKRLNPEFKISIEHLADAYVNFENGNYDDSLMHLGSVNYDHFLIKLYIRELSLLIYYEIGNIESAYLMIDSFHHFLSTNKLVSELHKKKYTKFLKIYKELLGLREGHSVKTANELRLETKENMLSLRPRSAKWLLEKISEFEEK